MCKKSVTDDHLRAANDMLAIAKQLTGLTTTQLQRIQHVLCAPVLEATLRASAITGTNQGRSREDKLVAKLLRKEHTNEELEVIQACYCSSFTTFERHLSSAWWAHRACSIQPLIQAQIFLT